MPIRLRTWLRRLRSAATAGRAAPGQIIVLFALFVVVLMVLAGSAYDYASIVVDDAQLQNSVDAAALAGSNALSAGAGQAGVTPVATASVVTGAYLSQNGVTGGGGTTINMTFPASTPVPGVPTPIVPQFENIQLSVTKTHKTAFWPLIGINSVQLNDSGSAHSARSMVDVMLSLDTTGSEVISGSFASIQQAVGAFVTTMHPSTLDSRGPQIGIARFAGIECQYDTAHGHPANYDQGCVDDYAVLTKLTNDSSILQAVANGPNSSPCPALTFSKGGCPIEHLYYDATTRSTSPSSSHDPFTGGSPWTPGYTGTKLPNGFTAMGMLGNTIPIAGNYAWDASNGGRVNATANSPFNARKVMVMMTDGQNEMYPTPGPGGVENVTTYNTNVQAMATALQNGPDGLPGTYDDVEIYVVGYFCTPYSAAGFCQSTLADASPHGCPGPTWPPAASPSNIDTLLNNIASSSAGTCDHYFPLSKSEAVTTLPALFSALAGRISRGQLTK